MTEPLDLDAIRERYAAWQRISGAGNDDLGEGTVAMLLAGNDVPLLLAEVERLTAELVEVKDLGLSAIRAEAKAVEQVTAERDRALRELDDVRATLALRDGELVSANAQRDAERRKVEVLMLGDKALQARIWLNEELARIKAERDAMRPVVEAGREMREYLRAGVALAAAAGSVDRFVAAVDAYTAAQTPGVDTGTSEPRTAGSGAAGPADGAVPAEVYEAAARASVAAHFPGRPTFAATVAVDVDEPAFRAAVEAAYRAGSARTPGGDRAETRTEPRTWALPAEPGPEVTAVRGSDGVRWVRAVRNAPGWRRDRGGSITVSWQTMLRDAAPLTDATGETP